MDNSQFGFKELYSVLLKTTYPLEIKGRKFEVGETVAAFDRISIANFEEVKNYKCYLLTDKEHIYSASDVIGIEQLPFSQYKRNLSCIIKAEVLSEFGENKWQNIL